MLNQEQAQQTCNKWADLFKIGFWKFIAELRDNVPNDMSTFRYNYQNGTVTLVMPFKEATEERIVAMLTDFARLYKMLGEPDKENEHYVDFKEDNIEEIINVIITLAKKANFITVDTELFEQAQENKYGGLKYAK